MSYTRRDPKSVLFPIGTSRLDIIPPTAFPQDISTERSGSRVQNFRKLIREGLPATSAYSRDSYIIEQMQAGSASIVYKTSPTSSVSETAYGFVRPNSRVPAGHLTSNASAVDSAALTLLYQKIRKETSEMNGLQFFGELREALRMIRRPADSLRKGLERYDTLLRKRKKGISTRQPLTRQYDAWKDVIAGTWLEVSFGWKPLVSDTQAIATTIARHVLNETPRTRVRAYKEEPLASTVTSTSETYANSDWIGARANTSIDTKLGVQYICGMKAVRNGPINSIDRLRSLSGLTLENFVPTLWELTPWSFFIDYFVNVGDIIEATFTNTTSVIWQMKTHRWRTTMTVEAQPYPLPGVPVPPWELTHWSTNGNAGISKIVKSSVTRTPLPQLAIPDVVFSLPGSAYKWGNIAALLTPSYHRSFRF